MYGFDTIFDDPNFAGGEFSYWQRQSIKLFGVNLVQRVSLVPNLRSSKIQGQSNFVNPGLQLINFGMDMEVAPKLRAMQIIEELEPNRRGVYCGAIGYIGFDGTMDVNIAIRTMVYSRGTVRFWAGGGIIADSKLEDEYQETFDKAAAMLKLLQQSAVSQTGA